MATTTAISSQLAAANSKDAGELNAAITVADGAYITVFAVPRLNGAETVTAEIYDGSTYQALIDDKYKGIVLTSRTNAQSIKGPVRVSLTKSATATATAIKYEA
jgi:hypothetical protein